VKKLSINLNLILASAVVFLVAFTWLAPKVIGVLFTPPVSFGMNCEPAAAWSMSKLIWTQGIGFILGAAVAIVVVSMRKSKPAPITGAPQASV
jgi:hypothetical protein